MTEIRDNKSAEINELAAALSKAQAEFTGAKKDSKNPFFKSNYASIESVIESTKEALAKHGLSVSQPTEPVDGRDYVRTTLFHSSGQFVDGLYPIVLGEKKDAQAVGSATSYARRYALKGILNIADHDDDGESTMGRSSSSNKSSPIVVPLDEPPHRKLPAGVAFKAPEVTPAMKKRFEKTEDEQIKASFERAPFELIDEAPPPTEEYAGPIAAVKEANAAFVNWPECCGQKMNQSKFKGKENEVYCFKCKSKRQKNW